MWAQNTDVSPKRRYWLRRQEMWIGHFVIDQGLMRKITEEGRSGWIGKERKVKLLDAFSDENTYHKSSIFNLKFKHHAMEIYVSKDCFFFFMEIEVFFLGIGD